MVSWQHSCVARVVGKQFKFPLNDDTVDRLKKRAIMERFGWKVGWTTGVEFEKETESPIPAWWIIPKRLREDRILFYLHGGGYMFGSFQSHKGMVARIAKACGCRAFVAEYALAPQFPFPAALTDSLSAYEWLAKYKEPNVQLVIGGDSAGGGLALATMQELRDTDQPLPHAAVLLSPWTDLSLSGESIVENESVDPYIRPHYVRACASMVLNGASPENPKASPLFGDFSNLPPILCQVGGVEILLDDSRRIAEKVKAAGGSIDLEVWDGLMHIWHFFGLLIPEARKAIVRIGNWVSETLEENP